MGGRENREAALSEVVVGCLISLFIYYIFFPPLREEEEGQEIEKRRLVE